jgi:hypothetical protein
MPQVVVIKKEKYKHKMAQIKKHKSKNAARTIAAARCAYFFERPKTTK